MVDPRRALIPIASLALACTDPTPTDAPIDERTNERSLPTPVRPEPAAIAGDQVVLIPQLRIGSPASWRMEPKGTRVAAAIRDGECGVWQLGTDDYLGAATTTDPCETWPALEPITMVTDPSGFSLDHPDGERRLVLVDDRFELSGSKPIQGRARAGQRYRTAAFSPDGARLAVFVSTGQATMRLEIWNLDSARLERSLAFESEAARGREIGHWLRWDDHSLIAIAHTRPPACDPDVEDCHAGFGPEWQDTHVVQIWRSITAAPDRFVVPVYPGEQRLEQLFLDPDHRWFVALLETEESRGSTGPEVEAFQLDGELQVGLGRWGESVEDPSAPASPLGGSQVRQWSSMVGSSFVEIDEYSSDDELGGVSVTWAITSLTSQSIRDAPVELEMNMGSLIDGDVGEHAVRVVFAGRDLVFADSDACPSAWEIEQAQRLGKPTPECEHVRVVPDGCAVVDASWAFDRVLLRCQDRWLLAAMFDLDQTRELARGTGDPEVVWGPGGLAISTSSDGLRLFDADAARLIATHTSVIDLHRAVLDEELDLALVRERGGLRVVDLRNAELGPSLAWTDPVEFAAFAPDRSQLAIAGAGELAVFLRGESQPVARWQTGTLAGVAFRQDGEVLWVGVTRALPELALDPATGEQVVAAQLDRVAFERIAAAELDPSWRWAIEDDGTFLRTLDGQAIDLISTDWAIAESGWFAGLTSFGGYRIRIGPNAPAPVITVESVADQLRRPDLIAEFFAGKPLPRPILQPPPGN